MNFSARFRVKGTGEVITRRVSVVDASQGLVKVELPGLAEDYELIATEPEISEPRKVTKR